jgi:pimeloyl-ACP methyl ester carboxylesterase
VTPIAARWGGTSYTVDLDGPVHYVDYGGPAHGPCLVLVHGLGGSHLNWCLLAPHLVTQARVLAVDLPGFGLSPPAGRATTVQANTALLDRFVRQVAGTPAILVGNSMGGMIAILEAAVHPDAVAGLVLVDPCLPPVTVQFDWAITSQFLLYALPRVGEQFLAWGRAKLPARVLVQQIFDLCCADSSRIPEDVVEATVALTEKRAELPGMERAFLSAARSVVRVLARRRWYRARMGAVRCPVLLVHGEQDKLVQVQAAKAAVARNPHWHLETLPDIGHLPHLELPDVVSGHILDRFGAEAADVVGKGAQSTAA